MLQTHKKVNEAKVRPLEILAIVQLGRMEATHAAAEYQPISLIDLNSSVRLGIVTATIVMSWVDHEMDIPSRSEQALIPGLLPKQS